MPNVGRRHVIRPDAVGLSVLLVLEATGRLVHDALMSMYRYLQQAIYRCLTIGTIECEMKPVYLVN